jgi:hypothetical protein
MSIKKRIEQLEDRQPAFAPLPAVQPPNDNERAARILEMMEALEVHPDTVTADVWARTLRVKDLLAIAQRRRDGVQS